MNDPNPIMAMLLNSSEFLGSSPVHEEQLRPLENQFDLGPGDKVLMATANTPLEEDFTLGEILNHEDHAETYPDWEERFTLNRHVLVRYFSLDDLEGAQGWFSRVKLIPITDEQYAEGDSWRAEGFPEEVPSWVTEAFTRYTDTISHLDPSVIPVLVTCEKCQQRDVQLHVLARRKWTVRAGQVQQGEKTVFVPVNDVATETEWTAHLVCQNPDCGATAHLDEEEWELPHHH